MTTPSPGSVDPAKLSAVKAALLARRLRDRRAASALPAAQAANAAPLTYAQQPLWVLDQLHPGRTTYNVAVIRRLEGPLDAAALRTALDGLVERHDVLRTTFSERDGEAEQIVQPVAPAALVEFDLAPRAAAEREAEARALLVREAAAPFDLRAGPPLRAALVRLGEREHLLQFVAHHLVFDGGSIGVLLQDLARLYARARGMGDPPLAPLALQYGQYAARERERLPEPEMARLVAYWQAALAGAPRSVAMPTDRPRSAAGETCGGRRRTVFSRELADGLWAVARDSDATLFMVLLAAFGVLLHRYSAQDDVVVGSAIDARDRRELEGLIGYLTHTVALRMRFRPGESFADFVARVRLTCLGAFEHQAMPYERLASAGEAAAGSSLFSVMFVLQSSHSTTSRLGEAALSVVPSDTEAASFELSLSMAERPNGLHATMQYRTALFDAASIDRLLGHLGVLLAGVVANPQCPIDALPFISAEELGALEAWNATDSPEGTDATVLDMFARAVSEAPGALAVACGAAGLTYAELDARSGRLAGYLGRRSIGPGTLVGVCMKRSPELVVALLGVLKSGAAYVPLDPADPAERIAYVLETAGTSIVLAQPETTARLPASVSAVLLDSAGDLLAGDGQAAAGDDPPPAVSGEALVYVAFGATGRPNGAMIRHRGLANYLRWCVAAYDVRAGSGAPVHSSIAFDAAVTSLWAPLVAGRTVFLLPESDGVEALAAALRERPNFSLVKLTPAHLDLLRAQLERDEIAGATRAFIAHGEALAGESLAWWQVRAPQTKFVNEYGPDETLGCCAEFVRSAQPIVGQVSIGRPIANTRLQVLDRGGQPVPVGVAGELYVGGAGVAAGYVNRPDLTAERFVPDRFAEAGACAFRTGHTVRRLPDGRLEFIGRLDEEVTLRGFRVALGEIEAVLLAQPGIRQAAVTLHTESSGEAALAAYYVAAPARGSGSAGPTDIRMAARAFLPGHMLPAYYVRLDALPLTPDGKVDRAALPAPDPAARARLTAPFRAPHSKTEEAVARVFAGLLACEQVGADDDFFELGGHSLLAVRALGQLAVALGATLPLRDFFAAPTPAGVAEALGRSDGGERLATIPRLPGAGTAPLSYGQEMLWLHEQRAPGLNTYNVPLAYRVSGRLDPAALQGALDALAARHSVLAARFYEESGTPVQDVEAGSRITLELVDLRAFGAEARAAEARRLLLAGANAPFDLAAGPALRALAVRLTDDESALLLVVHHLAFDGSSAALLLRDLAEAYESVRAGRQPVRVAPAIRYADFAAWQRRTLAPERVAALEAFWRRRLHGVPAAPALPYDRPRRAEAEFESARRSVVFAPAVLSGLQRVALESGVTLFMAALAAFQTLLHRYTAQPDVVVRSPVSGRTLPQTLDVIGYFVNALAFRADFSDDPTFRTLLTRTRTACLEAYEHAELPLEMLLAGAETSARESLNVMLLLEEHDEPDVRLGDLRLAPLALERGVSPLELTVALRPTSQGLRAAIHYRAALFDAETIDRLLEHFGTLLAAVAAQPETCVSALPLLGEAERSTLLRTWNATEVPLRADLTLDALFEEQVARTPEAVAVVDGSASLTYAALDARANTLAALLLARGVAAGELVGVCAHRSVALVAGLLGILKAGAAYVPLDPDYPPERRAFMLEDSGVRLVLADDALRPLLGLEDERVVSLTTLATTAPAAGPVPRRASPSSPAYMLYTSGSTGRPKGALNAHRAVGNRLLWMQAQYRLGPEDVVLQKTPYSFDVSVWELFWPLLAGARLVMARPGGHRDNAYLIETIVAERVSVVHFVPSMLRAFLAQSGVERCVSLRDVMSSGEALPADVLPSFFARLPANLHNLYGPTEAAVDVSHWTVPRTWSEPVVPIGRPVANTRLYVLDARGAPVPIGVPGELHIGGVQVGLGYHRRAELTAEKFVPDPYGDDPAGRLYRTGDLVRYRVDGNLEYLGRLDQQVKLRGFRIELGEIEATLLQREELAAAVVVVRDDAPGGAALVAYYVPAGDQPADDRPADGRPAAGGTRAVLEAQLRAHLAVALPDYMVPAWFEPLSALPLSANGKLDRRALPAPTYARGRHAAAGVAPASATESVLARVVAGVLQCADLGVEDDFFAVGGHSLGAMRVVAHAAKLFRSELSVRSFFEAPTVRGLAASLVRAEAAPGRTEAIAGALERLNEMSPEERERRRAALREGAPVGS